MTPMVSGDGDDSRQHQSLLIRHRSGRTGALERDTPFSWLRCLISLFSYALLLSDVIRTGLGIHSNSYPRLEPSQSMFFGPFAYSVAQIAANNTADSRDIWAFKYDTTSIAMRSYAELFQLKTWSPCLLYKTPCSQQLLKDSTILGMMNSLVDAMAQLKARRGGPSNLTLRTTNIFRDRIHHFILPQIFSNRMTRTNQAIYYDEQLLKSPGFKFCAHLPSRVQPYACSDPWTHFAPICRKSNHLCGGVDHVFEHVLMRHRLLQQKYSNMSLDQVILESHDDPSKPAISFKGRKFFNVVVITRVRNCGTAQASLKLHGACPTVAVDDFRYEGASSTSNVISWFAIIATLRALGQLYAWLRLSMLFVGCFFARSAEPLYADAGLFTRLRAGLRTMLTIPSQVVIYGSVVPIACYVLAHLLDSAMVYELVAQTFNSPRGVFKLNLREFLQLSAVSMRSVWVLALFLHALLYIRTRRNWSAANGIPGIPEFSITFISCLTIMAQFRSVAFRDSRVESISEVVQSSRMASIRAAAYDNSLSFWELVFLGNTLDAKCLMTSAAVLSTLLLILSCCLRVLSKFHVIKRVHMFTWPKTRVSYAAGTLWPANALVVSWNGILLARSSSSDTDPGTAIIHRYTRLRQNMPAVPSIATSSSIFAASNRISRARVFPANIQDASRLLRRDFAILDNRNSDVESMIYLMNLAVMTDPVVLFRVWWGRGKNIGVYQSKLTNRLFLIPQEAVESGQDVLISWDDYEWIMTVSTKDLAWQDLLHCG